MVSNITETWVLSQAEEDTLRRAERPMVRMMSGVELKRQFFTLS